MSKRKLNQQQRARITRSQHQFLDETTPTQTGLVICCYGKRAQIETPDGRVIVCALRPNLPPLVAGDRVVWQAQCHKHDGIIVSGYPRQTVLDRLDKQGRSRPLAANVTQLIIVMAPEPTLIWSLLDSYLITAESLHLKAALVLNKTDLLSKETQHLLETHYAHLGYPLVYTTRQTPSSFSPLETHLSGQISIFVGQSGVGKSSLLATLLPNELNIPIAPLSSPQAHGRHTTTLARVYHLPHGGDLIDSPGVRSFHPPHFSPQIIAAGYREFRPFLGQCQFRNCDHITAPGCAILQAVQDHRLSSFRYETFQKILKQRVNLN